MSYRQNIPTTQSCCCGIEKGTEDVSQGTLRIPQSTRLPASQPCFDMNQANFPEMSAYPGTYSGQTVGGREALSNPGLVYTSTPYPRRQDVAGNMYQEMNNGPVRPTSSKPSCCNFNPEMEYSPTQVPFNVGPAYSYGSTSNCQDRLSPPDLPRGPSSPDYSLGYSASRGSRSPVKERRTPPPLYMTSEETIQETHQIYNRSPDRNASRQSTGLEAGRCGYSSPCDQLPPGKGRVDPVDVLEMIEEENKDVENMKHLELPELKGSTTDVYGLKRKLEKMKLNPEFVRQLESTVINPPTKSDELQEELQPEVIASMMHSEEKGLSMDSTPCNVYNYLFPDDKGDLVIEISSAAVAPLQNVVVPVAIPSKLHVAGATAEIQHVGEDTQRSQQVLPVDNVYTNSVLKPGAKPKLNNTGLKSKKTKSHFPALATEEALMDTEDLKPMIALVGAAPSDTITVNNDLADTRSGHSDLVGVLEYPIIPQHPRHVSRVQLRGSQNPSWFPGYYIALPDTIKVAKSPGEILPAAWQAVQPDIFGEDSFVILD